MTGISFNGSVKLIQTPRPSDRVPAMDRFQCTNDYICVQMSNIIEFNGFAVFIIRRSKGFSNEIYLYVAAIKRFGSTMESVHHSSLRLQHATQPRMTEPTRRLNVRSGLCRL